MALGLFLNLNLMGALCACGVEYFEKIKCLFFILKSERTMVVSETRVNK